MLRPNEGVASIEVCASLLVIVCNSREDDAPDKKRPESGLFLDVGQRPAFDYHCTLLYPGADSQGCEFVATEGCGLPEATGN